MDLRRRWRLACVAGVVAGVVLCGFAGWTRVPRQLQARGQTSPPHYDAACEVPGNWATFPVVASYDRAKGKPSLGTEGSLNQLAATTAPLGDVFIRFQSNLCDWGGSACAGARPTLHHVRVGPLDEQGVPIVGGSFACTGTPPLEPRDDEPMRSCDPSSLTLRRAPDGRTFVLTMRDPDPIETPISAFSRTPITPSSRPPPLRRGVDWLVLVGFAAATLAVGLRALVRARRFVRTGGILSWRDGVIADGMLESDGETALAVRGVATSFASAVLVAPSFLVSTSYREAPSVDVRALFVGPRATAEARTRRDTSVALVCFAIASSVAALGIAAYR